MQRRRNDRLVAIAAVGIIAIVAGLVVETVLDARRRGRAALERNQASTIRQLADSMDQRLTSTLEALSGLALGPYTFEIGDPADRDRLQTLQDLNPQARSGMLLLDPRGVVTNGTLLIDRATIGSQLRRPGLDGMFAREEAAILPVGDGVTTDLPTIAVGYPVRDAAEAIAGWFVFESVVAADSDFSKEIAALQQGVTGVFTFVDERGVAIVSTDPDRLAQPLESPLRLGPEGLHRQDGLIVGRQDVPSASWRLIFTQDVDEFEAGLGQRIQFAVILIVLITLFGGAVAFIAVLRRLDAERTERKRIEEIGRTREEFISIVSHELRTPVAGIAGYLDTTLDHWESMTEEAKLRAVQRARSNARRLQALTRDVLDSSALESGKLSYAFDVIDLAAEIAEGVAATRETQPEREIGFEPPTRPVWVLADPDRIQQVLINLFDNALRNSPRGTMIDVGVRIDAGQAIVTVRDHGPGIPEREREKIFDKWSRGHDAVQGTGLGLYVSRLIVEAHHGHIEVHPADGGGEAFSFSVPLTEQPVAPSVVG